MQVDTKAYPQILCSDDFLCEAIPEYEFDLFSELDSGNMLVDDFLPLPPTPPDYSHHGEDVLWKEESSSDSGVDSGTGQVKSEALQEIIAESTLEVATERDALMGTSSEWLSNKQAVNQTLPSRGGVTKDTTIIVIQPSSQINSSTLNTSATIRKLQPQQNNKSKLLIRPKTHPQPIHPHLSINPHSPIITNNDLIATNLPSENSTTNYLLLNNNNNNNNNNINNNNINNNIKHNKPLGCVNNTIISCVDDTSDVINLNNNNNNNKHFFSHKITMTTTNNPTNISIPKINTTPNNYINTTTFNKNLLTTSNNHIDNNNFHNKKNHINNNNNILNNSNLHINNNILNNNINNNNILNNNNIFNNKNIHNNNKSPSRSSPPYFLHHSSISPSASHSPSALSPSELECKAVKRQQRMIKNRESASLSRKRKKEYVQNLEDRMKGIVDENRRLLVENSALKMKISALEAENSHYKGGNQTTTNFISTSIFNNKKNIKKTPAKKVFLLSLIFFFTFAPSLLLQHGDLLQKLSLSPISPSSVGRVGRRIRSIDASLSINLTHPSFLHPSLSSLPPSSSLPPTSSSSLPPSSLSSSPPSSFFRLNYNPKYHYNNNVVESDDEDNNVSASDVEAEAGRVVADIRKRMTNIGRGKGNEGGERCESQHMNTSEAMRLVAELRGWASKHEQQMKRLHHPLFNSSLADEQKEGEGFFHDVNKDLKLSRKRKRYEGVKEMFSGLNKHSRPYEIDIFKQQAHPSHHTSLHSSLDLLLSSLQPDKNTFYLVSFHNDHLLLPSQSHNKSHPPRMSIVVPAFNNDTHPPTNSSFLPMMNIECEVVGTKLIHLHTPSIPIHHHHHHHHHYHGNSTKKDDDDDVGRGGEKNASSNLEDVHNITNTFNNTNNKKKSKNIKYREEKKDSGIKNLTKNRYGN